MSKRILALALVVILSLSVLAGCGGASTPDEPKDSGKENVVGFVTDLGGIDDRSFNQSTWEGVVKYADEQNWTKDTEYKFIQSSSDAEYISNLSLFGEDGYKLVIAAGFLFNEAMTEVSAQFPETNFVIIDSVVEQPNVASVTFAEHEGSFLVGVAAARATKTKKVGFIGGMDFPLIRKFQAGFEAGVHSVDSSIEVVSQYAGSFGDPGKGQTIASTMYEQNVDVIYHASGGTGNGVINEAKNRVEAGETVWVIGVDRNQYEDGVIKDGKSVVLTSMLKRVDNAAYMMMEAQEKGTFPAGKATALTLKEDGVGIPAENPNLDEAVVKEVNDYKAKIIAGEIKVPATMDELTEFKAQ